MAAILWGNLGKTKQTNQKIDSMDSISSPNLKTWNLNTNKQFQIISTCNDSKNTQTEESSTFVNPGGLILCICQVTRFHQNI